MSSVCPQFPIFFLARSAHWHVILWLAKALPPYLQWSIPIELYKAVKEPDTSACLIVGSLVNEVAYVRFDFVLINDLFDASDPAIDKTDFDAVRMMRRFRKDILNDAFG